MQRYHETISKGVSIVCPSLYFFIRCRKDQRNIINSYMHNNVVMQIVRSTSDHIAWIFLDDNIDIDDVDKNHEISRQESWASIFDDHYMTIKEYAKAYVSLEDIALLVPSYDALLRINIPRLQHQLMEIADGVEDSVLKLPSAVILEPPKYHYNVDSTMNGMMTASTPADAENAIFFGCVLHHLISFALSTGLFHEAASFHPNGPKFYGVFNHFFKHFHMTPFWDRDAYYFEIIEGKQFQHIRKAQLASSDFDSVCTLCFITFSMLYDIFVCQNNQVP